MCRECSKDMQAIEYENVRSVNRLRDTEDNKTHSNRCKINYCLSISNPKTDFSF